MEGNEKKDKKGGNKIKFLALTSRMFVGFRTAFAVCQCYSIGLENGEVSSLLSTIELEAATLGFTRYLFLHTSDGLKLLGAYCWQRFRRAMEQCVIPLAIKDQNIFCESMATNIA